MTESESGQEIRSTPAVTIDPIGNDRGSISPPTLTSNQLLGGHRAVTIEHEGTPYVLRATRNGKLILTK